MNSDHNRVFKNSPKPPIFAWAIILWSKNVFFSFSTKTFHRHTSYHWFAYQNVALRVVCSNFGQIARSIRIRFQNLNFRSFWPLCHFSNFNKNTWYGARLKPNCMLNSAMSLEMHFMIILSILTNMGSSGSVQPWPVFKNNQNLDFTRFDSVWPCDGSKVVKSRIYHGLLSLRGSVLIWWLVIKFLKNYVRCENFGYGKISIEIKA